MQEPEIYTKIKNGKWNKKFYGIKTQYNPDAYCTIYVSNEKITLTLEEYNACTNYMRFLQDKKEGS